LFEQFPGVTVEQGAIGLDVDVRVLSPGQEPRAFLDVEGLSLIQAEGQKLVVGISSRQIMYDLLSSPAQNRIAAQCVWPEPVAGLLTVRQDFGADRLVDRRVLIQQKFDQSTSLSI